MQVDFLRRPHIVGVKEGDVLPTRLADTMIFRGSLTFVLLDPILDPGIIEKRFHNLCGIIGGAIIHYQ